MAFENCIDSAYLQGALEKDEAEELKDRFKSYRDGARGTDNPGGPEAAAKDRLEADLRDAAARKERLAQLSADKIAQIRDFAMSYRDQKGRADVLRAFEGVLDNRNNELAGTPSVTNRRDALIGYAHGQLEQGLYQFRRSFGLGKRMNPARLDHVIDEAFGKGTQDPAARGFLQSWRKITDEMVDRFNAAGGDIAKLKDYFPQRHDARKLAAGGEQAWVDFIKPRLDLARMIDPRDGGALSPARLDEALHATYRRIVTDGAIDLTPSGQRQGRGALANQRQDHRFLQFKDAAAWRDYANAYGSSDVYATMMEHLHGLAKDTAALEILGPNPNATVEWMKQVVQSEAAKAKLGEPSVYRGSLETTSAGKISSRAARLDNLWNIVNGSVSTTNLAAADVLGAVKNVVMASQLPGAAVSAVIGDPAQALWASRFAGISGLRWLADLPKQILSSSSQREIVRAGLVMEDAVEHMTHDFRALSWAAKSKEASRYLPDRVFTWTGLTPFDQAKRRTSAAGFMFEAGDRVGQSLEQMQGDGVAGERFARQLTGHGIDAPMWDLIRSSAGVDHGDAGKLLRMVDVISSHPGNEAAFEAALRYSEAMHAFAEDAGPRGTARASAFLGRAAQKGEITGSVVREVTSYMTYPTTTLMSLIRATSLETAAGGIGRGAAFLTPAVVGLTLAGAMILQVKSILRGNDPETMNSKVFWARALLRGGATGFWGDWLLADYQRGASDQLRRLAGPVAGTAVDALAAVDPYSMLSSKFDTDKDINRTARLVGFAKANTPVLNMWWLKPVTDRLIWDRMQLLADPKAQANWARKAGQLQRDTGQAQYWRPGQALPDRAPDFSHLW